ncbi:hypothetical protein P8452_58763 [Trifolium repens]|nr:hypothetical protein P8452_58763 [Trifolium repens]
MYMYCPVIFSGGEQGNGGNKGYRWMIRHLNGFNISRMVLLLRIGSWKENGKICVKLLKDLITDPEGFTDIFLHIWNCLTAEQIVRRATGLRYDWQYARKYQAKDSCNLQHGDPHQQVPLSVT